MRRIALGHLGGAAGTMSILFAQDQWRVALGNPLGSSAVRLDGQFEPAAGATPGTFDLRLQMALDDLQFREVGGSERQKSTS